MWDFTKGGKQGWLNRQDRSQYNSAVVSTDSRLLVTAGTKEPITFWDLRTQKRLDTLPDTEQGTRSLHLTPDGKRLLTVDYNGDIHVWDIQTRKRLLAFEQTRTVNQIAISRDGKTLVAGCWQAVYFWDMETGKIRSKLTDYKGHILGIAFSPDGKTIAWTEPEENKLILWDCAAKKIRKTIDFDGRNLAVKRVLFTPDGTSVAVSGASQAINLHDAATGQERAPLLCWGGIHGSILCFFSGRQNPGGWLLRWRRPVVRCPS